MKNPGVLILLMLAGCLGVFPVDEVDMHRARSAMDKNVLTQSLHSTKAWHVQNGTSLVDALRPGAAEEDIIAEFESIDLVPTRELQTLWTWHDGGVAEHPLIWYHDLLSHEEAVQEYRSLIRNPLVRWDKRFVPVFMHQGEWYAVYCGSEEVSAGPVVHFFLEDDPKVAYTNLTAMMATMAEVFASGAVTWDAEKRTISDDVKAIARIHATHNPGIAFPYYVD